MQEVAQGEAQAQALSSEEQGGDVAGGSASKEQAGKEET